MKKYKQCTRCKEIKKLDEFHKDKNGKQGRRSICKKCKQIIDKERSITVTPVETKQCTKCKQWKESKYFNKSTKNKDGLQSYCALCSSNINKKWYNDNRNYHSNNTSINYFENRFERRKTRSIWYQNNWEKVVIMRKQKWDNNINNIKDKTRNRSKSPINFSSKIKVRKDIELYEKVKESVNGNVECKCTYCGKWFEPTKQQIYSRVYAINGHFPHNSEYRLYCSQQCKYNCPIFGQILYPKDFKPATSREVQPELRQLVFERDNYTCQRCGLHKNDLECGIHCHHIYPLNEDPIQSADIDVCITYCETCHKWIHQNVPGCGYGEMKC